MAGEEQVAKAEQGKADIEGSLYQEVGGTGLKNFGGFISEEFLQELDGIRGIKTYAEMRDMSSTIGAIMLIIETLTKGCEWYFEAASEEAKDVEASDFMTSCLDDMESTWSETLCEIMSMCVFGWAALEIILKKRDGKNSRYNDNRIGIANLPIRAQETLQKWINAKDANGNDNPDKIAAMEQILVTGRTAVIPIEKLILFRMRPFKNNPEGRSLLRNAYRPYFFLKRIEEIEAVGVEHDMVGIPIIKAPQKIFSTNATPDEKKQLARFKTLASKMKNGKTLGIVFPTERDQAGNPLYEIELLSVQGSKIFDTDKIINRYEKKIATAMLADFLFLGQGSTGSWALSDDKTSMFAAALGGMLDGICETINRKLVPLLCRLNGFDTEKTPTLKHGDLESVDMQKLAAALTSLAGTGIVTPDDDIENFVRRNMRLPEKNTISSDVGTGSGDPESEAETALNDVEEEANAGKKDAADRK